MFCFNKYAKNYSITFLLFILETEKKTKINLLSLFET